MNVMFIVLMIACVIVGGIISKDNASLSEVVENIKTVQKIVLGIILVLLVLSILIAVM